LANGAFPKKYRPVSGEISLNLITYSILGDLGQSATGGGVLIEGIMHNTQNRRAEYSNCLGLFEDVSSIGTFVNAHTHW